MANTVTLKIKRGSGVPSSLSAGELALDTTNKALYAGDGTSVISLGGEGAFVDKTSAQTIGGVKTFSETIVGSVNGNAATATALQTARDISLTGDATGTASSFSGAANAEIAVTLANSGVSAGTHTKVTVDAKGRVTVGANLEAADIPTLTSAKISDFDTQVRTSRLDQMAAPTASVALNSQKITGLADPSGAPPTPPPKAMLTPPSAASLTEPPRPSTRSTNSPAAFGDDPNFATTVASSIGEKLRERQQPLRPHRRLRRSHEPRSRHRHRCPSARRHSRRPRRSHRRRRQGHLRHRRRHLRHHRPHQLRPQPHRRRRRRRSPHHPRPRHHRHPSRQRCRHHRRLHQRHHPRRRHLLSPRPQPPT
jgi:hypothetical protein